MRNRIARLACALAVLLGRSPDRARHGLGGRTRPAGPDAHVGARSCAGHKLVCPQAAPTLELPGESW
jgi:hypothetical protein